MIFSDKINTEFMDRILFEDLFDLEKIQILQDKIAQSYGLAAIITDSDGNPITRESNFSRLCSLIRNTPAGYARCKASESVVGISMDNGLNIQKCLSCGLWDSGAGIYAADKHIANFLFGQAHDGSVTEDKIRQFAVEISLDPDEAAEAFKEIPVISKDKFEKIREAVYEIAGNISEQAYQNLSLRHSLIENKKKESKFVSLIENTDGSIWSVDTSYCLITGNLVFSRTYEFVYGEPAEPGVEVIKKNLPSEIYNLWKSYYDRALSGEKFTVEVSPENHSQRFKNYMEYRFNPISEDNGTVNGVTVFGRDISSRMKYLNRIKQINQLHVKMQNEKDFDKKIVLIIDELKNLFNAYTAVLWLEKNIEECCGSFNIKDSCSVDYYHKDLTLYPSVVSGEKILVEDINETCPCRILSNENNSDILPGGFLLNRNDSSSETLKKDVFINHSIKSIAGFVITGKDKKLSGFISVYSKKIIDSEEIDLLSTIADIVSDTINMKDTIMELNRLKTAIEQVGDPVIITDLNSRIQYVNSAFETVTGYAKEDSLGMNPRFLKSGLHEKSYYENMWAVLGKGDVWKDQLNNRRKDGTIYTEEAVISPVRNEQGQVINYVAIKRDVTDMILMEKQLLQNEKMKAIGHLAGGIAHDFNNILSAIIGYADISLLDLPENSQIYNNVNQILKAGDRAKNLVKQILSFSNKGNEKKNYISIIRVINEALELLKASIPSSINLKFNYKDTVSTVYADSTRIHEIIMNLCTNCSSALQDKGTITISHTEEYIHESIKGEIGESQPGFYNIISVKDDGPGIKTEYLPHIFEPFFTTKEQRSGTGMGLAVVFGIVKDHKGNIQVSSSPGNGADFKIYLPGFFIENNERELSDESAVTGTERILVIDDEKMLITLLKAMLEKMGYSVTTFSDSVEAFNEFRKNHELYDMVITDQTMPEMTGFELSKKILDIKKDIPIILCTGYSRFIDEEKAINSGIKGFLNKPVRKNELANLMRKLLDSK